MIKAPARHAPRNGFSNKDSRPLFLPSKGTPKTEFIRFPVLRALEFSAGSPLSRTAMCMLTSPFLESSTEGTQL